MGGYGHCGLYEFAQDKNLEGLDHEDTYIYDFVISFLHGFLRYQKKENAPIDFFSWHVYDNCHPSTKDDFLIIAEHAAYIRRVLDHYGYTNAEHHLNEWNLWTNVEKRDATNASAKSLGFMLMMQRTSTDVMCIYDGRIGYGAYCPLFSGDTGYPYRCYYALMSFNSLYRLKNEVESASDEAHVFVGAARKDRQAVIALANTLDEPVEVRLDLKGFDVSDAQVLRIDEENRVKEKRAFDICLNKKAPTLCEGAFCSGEFGDLGNSRLSDLVGNDAAGAVGKAAARDHAGVIEIDGKRGRTVHV